jgi:hypothetical protein
MTPLFKKLNFKNHDIIFCINAPSSFDAEIIAMHDVAIFKKNKIAKKDVITFVLAFVITEKDLEKAVALLAPQLVGDAIVWMCYPKMSSKKYISELNRDDSWALMGSYNLEPVRSVAIDEDWSALRFRHVNFIKTMKRKFGALSKEGKKRVENRKKL